MKKTNLLLMLPAALVLVVSCAKAKFSSNDGGNQGLIENCRGNCSPHHLDVFKVGQGPIDILFVLDNGGSVSDIQASMVQKFQSFLDSFSGLDYRIAVTTTDISTELSRADGDNYTQNNYARAINQNGALQDGKLIRLGSGATFLTPGSPQVQADFQSLIQRPETAQCVNSGYQVETCPSPDPRGIYAASLAIERNEGGFLRPGVATHLILISDDDERNGTEVWSHGAPYALTARDLPENLRSKFSTLYPGKSLTVSALVVPPGDYSCLLERYGRSGNLSLFGHYGALYSSLVSATGGVLGSVCSPNYTDQLSQIGANIKTQASSFSFACTPKNHQYQIHFNPQPASTSQATADWNTNQLNFSAGLPAGTEISVEYDCGASGS